MPDDEGTTAADLSAWIDELNALVLRLSASQSPALNSSPLPASPFSVLRSAPFSGYENPETFINDLERHYRLNAPFSHPHRVDDGRTAMSGGGRFQGRWQRHSVFKVVEKFKIPHPEWDTSNTVTWRI